MFRLSSFCILVVICVFFVGAFTARDAGAVTVQEVARELECPCDCPLVLEDCNMSCGLDWKDEIGEKIKAGLTKEEIVRDFIDRHGDSARITPIKRLRGKLYQYTRGFGMIEWVVLWGAVGLWFIAIFMGVFIVVRKVTGKKRRGGGAS